jgi:hypothetical protein
MIVYPDNAIKRNSSFAATNLASGNLITAIIDNFFDYKAIFSGTSTAITIEWNINGAPLINTIILGKGNASQFNIVITRVDNTTWSSGWLYPEERVELVSIPSPTPIKKLVINAQSSVTPLDINYLWAGIGVDIGLFSIGPREGLISSEEANRTKSGQVYGIKGTFMRTFNASFPRITNAQKMIQEEYIKLVGTIDGHVIDPYPEAHDEFLPFYATIASVELEREKRAENKWYWNTDLSWQEAN